MIETPAAAVDRYPAEDLGRYRFHTGAPLRPLAPDEPCPILFRDLGPVALRRFLRGDLRRLAGPLSPITYMRTADYAEPYVDYERIGRIVFLRPLLMAPWFSGVPSIFVARATNYPDPATIGWVPGTADLAAMAGRAAGMRTVEDLREELGGGAYDAAARQAVEDLGALEAALEDAERLSAPLRRALQSRRVAERSAAREAMERAGITEDDLCAAWHHLPRARREHLAQAIRGVSLAGAGRCA